MGDDNRNLRAAWILSGPTWSQELDSSWVPTGSTILWFYDVWALKEQELGLHLWPSHGEGNDRGRSMLAMGIEAQ